MNTPPTPDELAAWRELAERYFPHVSMPGIILRLLAHVAALTDKADAGERFKVFVHSYLGQHGVPHGDPTNQHQIEGCRIGARLDLLFAERDAARESEGRLAVILAHVLDSWRSGGWDSVLYETARAALAGRGGV